MLLHVCRNWYFQWKDSSHSDGTSLWSSLDSIPLLDLWNFNLRRTSAGGRQLHTNESSPHAVFTSQMMIQIHVMALLSRIPWKTYMIIAFLTVGTMGLSNTSLGYLNYPTQVIFKCCKLIPVMIGGMFIQGEWSRPHTNIFGCVPAKHIHWQTARKSRFVFFLTFFLNWTKTALTYRKTNIWACHDKSTGKILWHPSQWFPKVQTENKKKN